MSTMSRAATLAPRVRKREAVAAPIPLLAPVTMTTWSGDVSFWRGRGGSFRRSGGGAGDLMPGELLRFQRWISFTLSLKSIVLASLKSDIFRYVVFLPIVTERSPVLGILPYLNEAVETPRSLNTK